MDTALRHLPLALAGALLVLPGFGCERGSGMLDPSDAQHPEQLVAEVVKAEWDRLVTADELEDRVEAALASEAAGGDAQALLSVYRGLRTEAGTDGGSGSDRDGGDEGLEYLLQAAVLTLGPELPDEVVSGATHVHGRALQALGTVRASGGSARGVRNRLDEVEGDIAAAGVALASGDELGALRRGMRAAEALRRLAQDEFAARWLERAENLLSRASEMAGADPAPRVAEWLATAERLLSQGRSAFEQGNYRDAVRHARASARMSWQVISYLRDGLQPPSADELADRAIQVATNLLARAVEMAGPDPAPRVAEALDEARRLLDAARDAHAAEEYREAIRGARMSAALSLRVIHYLAGGSRPGR